ITKATPTVSWSNPADITYPATLGAGQLNATASVPGAFTYTPGTGTVLNAGGSQLLSVHFVPTDTTDYNTPSDVTVHINVLQASQTITFAALPDKTFGDADFSVSATGGASGQSVTFTASGQCSVTGTLVHLTAAGSCSITAHQPGNANYAAATDV